MLKKNNPLLLITLAVVTFLLVGGITSYSLWLQRNILLKNAPLGSQLIPQDALVMASISTNPFQWQELQQYGSLETQAALNKQLADMGNNLLTANGYNYEKDIQPSLAQTIAIAYFDTPTSSIKPQPKQNQSLEIPFSQTPDLIVLPIENPTQAKQILDRAKSQKVTQVVERIYKGIQIRETQKNNETNYSATALGRFFVVTNNPTIMDRVIDTYKGADSIITPDYVERLAKITATNTFAQVYFNIPALSTVAAVNSKGSLSPEKIAASEQKQGIATTVILESEGIRFKSISWLKPKSQRKYKVKNTNSRLPRCFPANTLLMISGGNLAQLWQEYAATAESNPLAPMPPANFSAGLQATLGLDLQKDLLPWMEGEFALALIPAPDDLLKLPENLQPSPTLGAGIALMVLSSDRASTDKAFQKLDEALKTRYQFTVENTQINGQPVVKWTSPLGGVIATHGWLEGNIVFFTLGAPITSAILPQPSATLIQTGLFQQVVPNNPKPNNGQIFIDIDRTLNRSTLNLPTLPKQPKSLIQAIRAMGFTIAISDERSTRFDIFVKLQKALTPKLSPPPNIEISPSSTPKSSGIKILPTPKISVTPSP